VAQPSRTHTPHFADGRGVLRGSRRRQRFRCNSDRDTTAGPPTETPTRTPTLGSRPLVEAYSESNIRAGPDISESLIGQIFAGTQYQVIGKIGNWYQIEYPNSPSGTAWVYFEVVKVIGDPALIPDLNPADVATVDPAFLAEQETAQAIANTPGAAATLTAQVQITPTGAGEAERRWPGAPLPTFTYPAYTPTPVPFPRTNPPPPEASGMPPLVPILALGALGLMGLLVAVMRRL
jgi:hypothetical protein